MSLLSAIENLLQSGPLLRDATASGNLRVLRSLLGPAYRGLVEQRANQGERTLMSTGYPVQFDWGYKRTFPERPTMSKRIVPNLERIGLLSDRIRPRYEELGLLRFEHGKAAPDLTAQDLLEDR